MCDMSLALHGKRIRRCCCLVYVRDVTDVNIYAVASLAIVTPGVHQTPFPYDDPRSHRIQKGTLRFVCCASITLTTHRSPSAHDNLPIRWTGKLTWEFTHVSPQILPLGPLDKVLYRLLQEPPTRATRLNFRQFLLPNFD